VPYFIVTRGLTVCSKCFLITSQTAGFSEKTLLNINHVLDFFYNTKYFSF
jgi:hypothetical protein